MSAHAHHSQQAQAQMLAWEAHMSSYCPGRQSAFELSAELLFSRLPEGGSLKLADLGCGFGGWSAYLQTAAQHQNHKLSFTGLDNSAPRLAVYQTLLGPETRIRQGDFFSTLPELAQSEQASFDAVLFGWAAHELAAEPLQALYSQIYGLLKPGGLLLIADFMTGLQPEAEALALQLTQRRRARVMADPVRLQQEQALRGHGHGHGHGHQHGHHHGKVRHFPPQEHRQFLATAGFEQVEEVWRYLNNRMLMASKT